MESTINNHDSFEVIRGPERLNSIGCGFFLDADNSTVTLISSNKLRWLTHENNESTFYTKEQEKAIGIISEAQQRKDMAPPFLMNILLYSDPRKLDEKDCKYIKALLQCTGVDVRYLKTSEEHRLRIALKGNKLFLSMSGSQVNEVHEGLLYEAADEHNPLLKYFKNHFNHDFQKAKPLELANDKIVFKDKWIKRFLHWCTTETGIVAILSGIIAIIASIIIEICF